MHTGRRVRAFCQGALFSSIAIGGSMLLAGAGPAQAQSAQAPVSAEELLKRVDRQANTFKDATFHFKMKIKETSGPAREVEFVSKQKGTQKRIVRFLAPANVKGMGILMENADTMYALLPEFNNRVRRMGMHAAGQSFFGSDLVSEDMAAIEFQQGYAAKSGGADGAMLVLELSAKPGKKVEFPRLKMWVDGKTDTVTKIEYYDAAGKKLRTQTRSDFRKDEATGTYGPWKLTFTDHRKDNHETDLILLKAQYNTGLSDDEFTVRALQRGG